MQSKFEVVFLYCSDVINRVGVEAQLRECGFDPTSLPIQWIALEDTVTSPFIVDEAVKSVIPMVMKCERSPQPVANLCLALQCGGSDAFSGVTANPLQGAVAEYVIERGGSAVLAETGECDVI